jgi:hypothetical protein
MYKHVIAGGCSFTACSTGGLPPTDKHPNGGNSYTYDLNIPAGSWAAYVARQLNSLSFVNVAIESHGNYHTAISLVHVISKFNYTPADTLVLFNITDLERYDVLTTDNENKCKYQTWDQTLLDYNIVSRKISDPIRKIKGDAQTIESNVILNLLTKFLESSNINYRFLMMGDYTHLLDDTLLNNKNLIKLPNGVGMIEYCRRNQLNISESDYHPTVKGHASIGKLVLETL